MANSINEPIYEQSVFINCPFDLRYKPLLHAIVFAIRACDFTPRCALEFDGDSTRLQKILDIIRNCKFGVHDVSISDSRLNMPFELGLFLGCIQYGKKPYNNKQFLILEGKPYSSKSYLSDLAGNDPMWHEGDEENVIKCLRTWLASNAKEQAVIPSSKYLINSYQKFKNDLPAFCAVNNWDHDELLFPEYLGLIETWLTAMAVKEEGGTSLLVELPSSIVSPNPVRQGKVHIRLSTYHSGNTTLLMRDIKGTSCFMQTVENVDHLDIDFSSLSIHDGLYLLTIESLTFAETKKIAIMSI